MARNPVLMTNDQNSIVLFFFSLFLEGWGSQNPKNLIKAVGLCFRKVFASLDTEFSM